MLNGYAENKAIFDQNKSDMVEEFEQSLLTGEARLPFPNRDDWSDSITNISGLPNPEAVQYFID